jgi:epoxyqueuosine reductase
MAYLATHEPLKASPENLLEGAKSVIAVTLNYYQEPPTRIGKVARYALGRDYHKVLRSKLNRLAAWLQEMYPEAQCRACVDSAPVLDRAYANLAGLGWFGKNTMLIDSKRGSWFFIGLLLTTVELVPDEPSEGGCGTCSKCIDACPTGAIKQIDQRWQVDSRVCISYQTIESKSPLTVNTQGWAFESQPFRASKTVERDFLLPLAQAISPTLTPEEWDHATKGSPIRRAGYEGWKRNNA